MPEYLNPGKKKQTSQPYSAIVKAGNLMFISGQIGRDPDTEKMAEGGIGGQTKQALHNIIRLVEGQGLTSRNIVKTTVFLLDIEDFGAMNMAYREFFNDDSFPARSTVAVSALPSPEACVEIEAIAVEE